MIVFMTLLKNDIKLFLKDWKACLLLLLAPVAFIAFFTYALGPYLEKSSFVQPFEIALVDLEDSAQTRMLVSQFDEMEIFSTVAKVDKAEADRMLADGGIAAIVVIPGDFTSLMAAGTNIPISVTGNSARPLEAGITKNLMQSAANLVSAAQSTIMTIYRFNSLAGIEASEIGRQYDESVMTFFLEALSRKELFVELEGRENLGLTPAEYFTAALLAVFLMFSGMPGMKMLVTEKTSGISARLAASPAGVFRVVLSKLAASLILSVLQGAVIILATLFMFRNYWGAPVKSLLLLFGALVFAVSAWSVFVSAISRTPAAADALGNLGILLMAVVGGSIYPLSSMPGFIRDISRITINRWAMDGFMVLFSGNELISVRSSVLALIIIGVVFFGLSVPLFRRTAGRAG
ncbi:MAG: ABC transporter permease [Clostridiales bacterium]|nr:ABC transporter permease [Clostridiales bacterium]